MLDPSLITRQLTPESLGGPQLQAPGGFGPAKSAD